MASNLTLTQIAGVSRKAIYAVLIGFVVLAVTTYIMRQIQDYERLHPPLVVQKPNYLFGRLPELVFPKSVKRPVKMSLQIASGFLPATPSVVKVFSVKSQKFPGFDPVAASRDFAARVGFSVNEVKINDEEYSFTDKNNPLRSIKINVVNQSFELTSDLKSGFGFITGGDLPSPQDAINFSRNFLQTNNLWVPEDAVNDQQVFYYKITPLGDLIQTQLPFEANLIKIVFRAAAIDKQIVFSGTETDGPVTFLLSGGKEGAPQIVELKYNYFSLDEVNFGTYLAKSASVAWDELKSGGGYVSNFGLVEEPLVNNVYLGFYDSLNGSSYVQPIWVFESDKGFRAFVAAVLPK